MIAWKYRQRIAARLAAYSGQVITSDQDLNDFLTYLYEQRVPLAEIADMFGVSLSLISHHLDDLGIRRSVQDGQRKGWRYFREVQTRVRNQGIFITTPHELDLWCRKQYERGMSVARLAQICGVAISTMKDHLRRVDTPFRGPGGNHNPAGNNQWQDTDRPHDYTLGEHLSLSTPAREYEDVVFQGWYYNTVQETWDLRVACEGRQMVFAPENVRVISLQTV